MTPIPEHLLEELDWIKAYIQFVKHTRAQKQDPTGGASAACHSDSNPQLKGRKRPRSSSPAGPESTSPPLLLLPHRFLTPSASTSNHQSATTTAATAAMPSTLDISDGPMTLHDFEARELNDQQQGLFSPGSGGGSSSSPVPVALGQPRSSEPVQALFRLAQTRRLTPVFEFSEPAPQKHAVRLAVGAAVAVEDPGPFGSKKEAKEAVCRRALDVLRAVPVPSPSRSPPAAEAAGLPAEQWVSVLNNWTQMTGSPAPSYQEFALGSGFACEVTITKRLEPFGSRNTGFANKKAARLNAAQEAVVWLRETGIFDAEGPMRKKQKLSSQSSSPSTSSSPAPGGSPAPDAKGKHFVQKVDDLCRTIDLKRPDYRLAAAADAPLFFSGHAVFTHAPASFQDRTIGEVRHVRGRNAAKEACARKVLQFLEEHVQRSRARVQQGVRAARESRTEHRQRLGIGGGAAPQADSAAVDAAIDSLLEL